MTGSESCSRRKYVAVSVIATALLLITVMGVVWFQAGEHASVIISGDMSEWTSVDAPNDAAAEHGNMTLFWVQMLGYDSARVIQYYDVGPGAAVHGCGNDRIGIAVEARRGDVSPQELMFCCSGSECEFMDSPSLDR